MGHGIINNLSDAILWELSSSIGGINTTGAYREIYYTPGDDSTGITQSMAANKMIKFVLYAARGSNGFPASSPGGVGGKGEIFTIETKIETTDVFRIYCAGSSYPTGLGGLGGIPTSDGDNRRASCKPGTAGTYGGAGGGASGSGYTTAGTAYVSGSFIPGGVGGKGGSSCYVYRKRDGESTFTFLFGALAGSGGGGGGQYTPFSGLDPGGRCGGLGTKTTLLMTGGAAGSGSYTTRTGQNGFDAGTNSTLYYPKVEIYSPNS